MAISWNYDASQYKEKSFELIPVGDYRVRIEDVVEKTFKSGNQGFELTLEVNGQSSRVWHYLVLDPSAPDRTNQKLGEFFDSFGINNHQLGTGNQWIGMIGAARIKHEEYNGNTNAKVAYLISRGRQDKLEPWKNGNSPVMKPIDDDVPLPFDV